MLGFNQTAAFFSRRIRVEGISKPSVSSETKTSFSLLPVEIRWNIYRDLLLDENVTEITEDKRPRLSFQTALFTVSRQISSESLEFFYRENTFVLLKTNMKDLFKACQVALPMMRYANAVGSREPPLACTICLESSYREKSSAIFTARDLPIVIQLLNIEHLQRSTRVMNLTLDFPQRVGESTIRTGRDIDHIMDGLSGIRKFPDLRHTSLNLNIEGTLPKYNRELIETNFAKPAPTPNGFVEMALQARRKEQVCLAAGDYTAARAAFKFCSHLTRLILERAKHPWPWNNFSCNRSRVECLVVDLHLDMSLIETAQGYHEDAIWHAEKAWEMAFAGADPFGQVADLKFSLGVALAAAGRYQDSVGALAHACAFDPENGVMRTMLESLKALLEEQKEGCTGAMFADGEKSLNLWFEVAMVERRSQKVTLGDSG